ncbi:MAG: hypothetical protein H6R13_615 [Proteobacteria bacterium]|nr:hypothetical protein [Pseudomonadota bacterium]
MSDQRKHQRYILPLQVNAAIETDHWRYVGAIANISRSGMAIRVSWHLSTRRERAAKGAQAFGEYAGLTGVNKMPGAIARADVDKVTMQFDSPVSPSDISQILGDKASTVAWRKEVAYVEGSLGFDLRGDFIAAMTKRMRLDMSRVSSIDSAGVGLALLALDRGATLGPCSPAIQPMLGITQVCARCGNCAAGMAYSRSAGHAMAALAR